MQIENSVVVITGAASGLGWATAQVLEVQGARVALLDRQASVFAQADTLGGAAMAATVDVTDTASAEAAYQQVMARWGRIDALINCAGIGGASRTLGKQGPMPLDLFQRIVQVNLLGSFNMARLAAEQIAKNAAGDDGERGVIIHTASIAAYEGQVGQVAYSASKGGIVGMTLPMARDLAGMGIRVNTIAPGIFATPLMQAAGDEVSQPLIAATQFPKRLGLPQEFGELVAHILGNRFINGEVLRIDGALRMPPR